MSLEDATQRIGRPLLERARSHAGGRSWSAFWSDKLLDWAMRDRAFKTQLFRFIDVFPMLGNPQSIHEHLAEYLTQPGVQPPPGLSLGLKAGALAKGALSATVGAQVRNMAGRFIAGVDADDALPRLRGLWDQGIAFSVDLLGEACLSDAEAHAYQQRYLDLIRVLPGATANWPANPTLDADHLGPIPRVNVSIKISALSARTRPIDFQGSLDRLVASLEPILRAAGANGVLVNFDMEQHALKDLTLALFERCGERFDFEAGIALQAYLRSAEADARRLIDWSRRAGRVVTVRLIKGAYWDYETIHARLSGWPAPVWTHKADTDACFERLSALFIGQIPRRPGLPGVKLALGSHNVRSIAHALALLESRGLPSSAIELQMLHGMADPIKAAAVDDGLRVREYAPLGQMLPGMAYLVRRLLENTSNASWLRAGLIEGQPTEQLLAPPQAGRSHRAGSPDVTRGFVNEPLRDFSDAAQRERFAAALEEAQVPNVAPVDDIAPAVRAATGALASWRDTDPRKRAEVLTGAADLMRQHRHRLAGVLVKEAGKTWAEADAEVCEAIDFCVFYAREAVELFQPRRLGDLAGEDNTLLHEPRGVAAVISPWNFGLSICGGMTAAALVTGNPVLVKPAEQTPGIARVLCEILWQAGAPRKGLQLLPGVGEVVGAALVRHPDIALIAFTGSKAVGLEIVRAAGDTMDGQLFVKQVVCEMGGKNAVIVDATADLDEAVAGVRASAFSYSGQKCSACSRVVVLDAVHDLFLRRLVEATRALTVGDPKLPGTDVGPLIDEAAAQKVRSFIEVARGEGKLELAIDTDHLGQRYVGPHLFSAIQPTHRLAREEVFGPVLAVMRAGSFEEALTIANGTEYKLTGGVYSRTPSHLEAARRRFLVGNLYLNRGITGALVGRQPFGGLGLSGVGAKAGGRGYLEQFVRQRVVTENTMRRGFAPA